MAKKKANKKDVAAFEELARKVADTAAGKRKGKKKSEIDVVEAAAEEVVVSEETIENPDTKVSSLVENALQASAALFDDDAVTDSPVEESPEPEAEPEKPRKSKKSKKKAVVEAAPEEEEEVKTVISLASLTDPDMVSEADTMGDILLEDDAEAAGHEEALIDGDGLEMQSESGETDAEVAVEAADADGESVESETEAEDESTDDGIEAEADDERKYEFFVDHDRLISVIESLLFSTDKAVSIASIRSLFRGSNVRTSKQVQKALDELMRRYADPKSGVTLEEIGGGYQLRTKVDNAEYLKKLIKVRPFKLSGPALEVMSIIAYKQPIPKAEVDQIRGVESGHLLRALMERGLVAFEGKSEDLPGKPMLYGTTRKFLEIFGLRNIKELPSVAEVEELLPDGIGQEEKPKEKLSDITGDLSQTIGSTYSEGEEELLAIADELGTINTKSEFFEQEKQRQREQRDRERAQDIRERLLVGEAVEEKDKKWLTRYEAALLNPAPVSPEAAGGEAGAPRAEGENEAISEPSMEAVVDPGSEIGESLEALDAEEPDEEIEHDSSEDLAAHPNYKDENEAEA